MRKPLPAFLTCVLLSTASTACHDGEKAPLDDAGVVDAAALREAELAAERQAAAERAAEAERQATAERARAQATAAREQARLRAEAEAAERAEREARAQVEATRLAFEARWPLYGVAFHFLTRVYAEPSTHAMVIGYMRRGSRFRAGNRTPGVGCTRGFHPVPGGGFVCRSEGTKIGQDPQSFEPSPVAPAIDDALPYAFVWVAHDHEPEFWALPTVAQEAGAREAIALELSRAEAAAARAAEQSAHSATAASTADAGAESAVAPEDADGTEQTATGDDGVEAPPPPGTEQGAEEDSPEERVADASAKATGAATTEAPVSAPTAAPEEPPTEEPTRPSYLRRVLRRGFYLSIDHEERDGGRHFLRTVRGGYVRADAVTANEPPTHRGVVLGGSWRLPVAFVYRGGTHRLRRNPSSRRLSNDGVIERLTPFPVAEEFTRRNRSYAVSTEGYLVRSGALRVARLHARPDSVSENERWIHVDLEQQTLVAYVGDEPRFATIVSTGREGYETPTGLFHIESKHLSTTMDDLSRGEDSYLIEDVPWTMYFEGNFALHAAFWHSSFGRVKSHGCVNLAPADARFLFSWSGPELPASWHGVFAPRGRPGTAVLITGPEPA